MDFTFSHEQEALRASVRRLMAERYPVERVAAIVDGPGFDRSEWALLADLGVAGISVPETIGGAGLGTLEEAVVAEELGRALYPGPFLSTVAMALPMLLETGPDDLVRGIASGERIATVAWAGPDGRFETDPAPKVDWDGEVLSATRLFVPDPAVADLLVVVGHLGEPDPGAGDGAGSAVWTIGRDAPGVRWRELPTVDATRRMGEVAIDRAGARLHGHLPGTLEGVRDRVLVALAAEAVGVAVRALELGVEHAGRREQFGRPVGAFQAVSHPLAQALVEVESARSLAYWAAWAVQEGSPDAPAAAAAAKARAAEAAIGACERAIQVHGGIGFTWEHPLHRFYKRALGISAFMGWGAELRARVARWLLD